MTHDGNGRVLLDERMLDNPGRPPEDLMARDMRGRRDLVEGIEPDEDDSPYHFPSPRVTLDA